MSYPDTQDLLIFVGIPLVVVGIIYALVYSSGARAAKRYRPGRPYNFAPVWFLAKPEQDGPAASRAEISGPSRAQIAAGSGKDHQGVTGGASDRW